MKTILSRLKTLITDNNSAGQTLYYVQSVEIVHPEIDLLNISLATLPKVLIIPGKSQEKWIASQEKEATHLIEANLILLYHLREASIMGDTTLSGSGSGVGIMDFVTDFLTVVRGHRLAVGGVNYLNRPLDISNIDYIVARIAEDAHILVAQITMQASRIFLQSSLPTNI